MKLSISVFRISPPQFSRIVRRSHLLKLLQTDREKKLVLILRQVEKRGEKIGGPRFRSENIHPGCAEGRQRGEACRVNALVMPLLNFKTFQRYFFLNSVKGAQSSFLAKSRNAPKSWNLSARRRLRNRVFHTIPARPY